VAISKTSSEPRRRSAGIANAAHPKQAIAIGLREAGASKYQSRKKNQENLNRTNRRERSGETDKDAKESRAHEPTRAELYAEARRRNVPGRSKMDKSELMRAVQGR
jgi:hypothetical protein